MIFWSTATHPKSTSITLQTPGRSDQGVWCAAVSEEVFLVPEEEYVDNVRKGIPSPRRSSNASTS
jgi:hypothetical protein